MSNKNVKHPCIGCVYFIACGSAGRTAYCAGRTTKTDRKEEAKNDVCSSKKGNA